jgi:uncharacterized membrane protein
VARRRRTTQHGGMDYLAIASLVAATGSAVMGGVFFAFSTFVMGALGRLPAAQGIAAMQSINVVVLNPLFLGGFLGTAAACASAIALSLAQGDPHGYLRIGGALVYLLGNVGVTRAFNIPRNDALAAVVPDSAEGARVWARYLVEWTLWNHVRTATGILAAVLLTLALRA